MSFPAGDRAEVPLERTVLAGAARFSRAGLAAHGAHGLHAAGAARPLDTPGPPEAREEDAGPAAGPGTPGLYLRGTHPAAAPAGQVPRLLTPAGFAAALAPRASPPPRPAPGAEERQQSQSRGLAPKTQRNFLFFLTSGNVNPGVERRWAAIQSFLGDFILNYLSLFPSGDVQRTGRDRNFAGGCGGFPQSLPPKDAASALPRSGERADASEGIETQGLPSCGRPMGLCGVPENPGHFGPGGDTQSVAGRE